MNEELRQALDRDELRVFYQPVVHLQRGTLAGLEALVRWQHPTRGLLTPAAFLDTVESGGMVSELGERVIARACATLRRWQERAIVGEDITVAVNVAPRHWERGSLVAEVQRILDETGLAARNLKLEITESTALQDQSYVVGVLDELRSLGVQACIDDFGTGYASLDYLRTFVVSTLKIDRSFVVKLGQERRSDEIVSAVIRLAHELGMDVVAEGVETQEQRQHLLRLGCDYGQGYLFARPMPERDMVGYVSGFSEATRPVAKPPFDDTMEHRIVVTSAAAPGTAARLVVVAGPATGRVFPLDGPETLIGRSLDASISIPDESLSRHHARIFRDPNGVLYLLDLGSRNGTVCNGQPVTKCPISDGDRIGLGRTVLVLERGGR